MFYRIDCGGHIHNIFFFVTYELCQSLPELGHFRLGQFKLGQVKLGQVRNVYVSLCQFRLGQVRLGQVRLGQVCRYVRYVLNLLGIPVFPGQGIHRRSGLLDPGSGSGSGSLSRSLSGYLRSLEEETDLRSDSIFLEVWKLRKNSFISSSYGCKAWLPVSVSATAL